MENSSRFNKSLLSLSGRTGLFGNFFVQTPLSGSYAEHSATKCCLVLGAAKHSLQVGSTVY